MHIDIVFPSLGQFIIQYVIKAIHQGFTLKTDDDATGISSPVRFCEKYRVHFSMSKPIYSHEDTSSK